MKTKLKLLLLISLSVTVFWLGKIIFLTKTNEISQLPEIAPAPTASISATPTPRPMTFAERNAKYGPCVDLPVLMYHHVEDPEVAKIKKRTYLNVPPETFEKQMDYLKEKGYTTISPAELSNFFDNGVALPKKSIMITLDDGYVDNGDNAFPILQKKQMKATIFIPTGLMDNPEYLSWVKINEMKNSNLIYFGNHTWSHTNVGKGYEVVKKELGTADTQLDEKGLNLDKVFAYPYGIEASAATKVLNELGYKLAFTTHPGRVQCKAQRLNLPRIRVGNASLSNFGI